MQFGLGRLGSCFFVGGIFLLGLFLCIVYGTLSVWSLSCLWSLISLELCIQFDSQLDLADSNQGEMFLLKSQLEQVVARQPKTKTWRTIHYHVRRLFVFP